MYLHRHPVIGESSSSSDISCIFLSSLQCWTIVKLYLNWQNDSRCTFIGSLVNAIVNRTSSCPKCQGKWLQLYLATVSGIFYHSYTVNYANANTHLFKNLCLGCNFKNSKKTWYFRLYNWIYIGKLLGAVVALAPWAIEQL